MDFVEGLVRNKLAEELGCEPSEVPDNLVAQERPLAEREYQEWLRAEEP